MSERVQTILVVDDEPLIRQPLADFLEQSGFKIFEAGNAEEAIALLQKSDNQVDLVFSDVVMPGALDGFGLAKWIKANVPDVPIILASGGTMKTGIAKDLGHDGPILTKPYRIGSIAERIRATLNSRTRGRDPTPS
jgi:DNA-binding response OmpR family regulator